MIDQFIASDFWFMFSRMLDCDWWNSLMAPAYIFFT